MCIRILINQYWLNAGSELTPNLDGLGVREGTEDCLLLDGLRKLLVRFHYMKLMEEQSLIDGLFVQGLGHG